MECVIGLSISEAKRRLTGLGFVVLVNEYVSKRGVSGADSTRVIRQRDIGNNRLMLTVSHFKTRIEEQE